MNHKEKERIDNIKRRDFIKSTALGIGATVLGGVGVHQASASIAPEKWDREADVVVIGFGGAGAAAAIEAHDAGADVVILEKMPGWGGNTAMSAGVFISPKKPLDMAIVDYLVACGKGRVSREMATAWATEAISLPEWYKNHLGEELPVLEGSPPYHPYAGGEQVRYQFHPKGGAALFKVLADAVKARKFPVLMEHPVLEILSDKASRIIGVLAEYDGRKVSIKANKGVVLACGGFDYNESLKLMNLRVFPTYSTGNPGNTGDAVVMAGKLGARMWKMGELNGCLCFTSPKSKIAWGASSQLWQAMTPLGMVIVNKYGRRFTNERLTYDAFYKALCYYDPVKDEYPNVPCHVVFDETVRLAGGLGFGRGWSQDNTKEIQKGWIAKGDTIPALAESIGLDPESLQSTVDRYNQFCQDGKDPDFNGHMLKALATPPYYSIQGYPGSYGTMGGPEINTKAQVLDTYGKVIPKLFAAGNASTGAWGFHYNGGGGIADALAFGRIAGRNASKGI